MTKHTLPVIAAIGLAVGGYGCTSLSDTAAAGPVAAIDNTQLVFECSGEEPFWWFRAEPKKLVWKQPSPDGVVEQISKGSWSIADEVTGRYSWAYDDSDKKFVIVREQCITVSSEVLSYRLERRDMPEGCCRRFTE